MGRLENRRRQRMLARLLQARRQTQAFFLAPRCQRLTFTSVGFPSVSVPVLLTISTRRAVQRSEGFGASTRMPAPAPRPMPTMIAIGVASPSAQGKRSSAPRRALRRGRNRASPPQISQPANGQPADSSTAA